MSELESLLRRDLERRAAAAPVPAGPPDGLVVRVARRRRSRVRARVVAVPLVVALLTLPAVLDVRGDGTEVVAGRGDTAGALPAIAPALSGSVVANVETNPCANTPGRECVSNVVRFHLGSSESLEPLDTGDWSRVTVLPDGRYVARDESRAGLSVLVDPSGAPPLPLGRDARSVDVLPDGRLIMLATDDAGRSMIRTIDERTGAVEDRDVPSKVRSATAVTGGPDGAIAVVGKGGGCCALRDLVVISADGRMRHHRLSMPDRMTPFTPAISGVPLGFSPSPTSGRRLWSPSSTRTAAHRSETTSTQGGPTYTTCTPGTWSCRSTDGRGWRGRRTGVVSSPPGGTASGRRSWPCGGARGWHGASTSAALLCR